MKVLWAPWRMGYILSNSNPNDKGCIFCPGKDRRNDEDRLILGVGPLTLVMMNKFPYNNGHLLVAPVRHVPGLDHLSNDEAMDLMLTVRRAIELLKDHMNPEGFNVGLNLGHVAGAGMEDHMHFHIVPRWKGDTNYMTVVGEVRVIPEHIQQTYRNLLPFFNPSK